MASALYIANESITAIVGKMAGKRLQIRQTAKAALPAGAVLGGIIMDEKALSETLQQLSGQIKGGLGDVRVVIGGSQIYCKRSVVPKMPKRKLLEWEVSEFTDVDTENDELIYDCLILSDLGVNQGNSALLCAARRSLIASYAELFQSIKIKLGCIEPAVSAMQKLIGQLEATREATSIVLNMDGNSLEATLFVKGEFRISNRMRLIAARGTAESTAEISRMVSSIIQFNLSERSGEAVHQVLVLGSRPEEQAMLNSIQTAYDLPTSVLTDGGNAIAAPNDGFVLADYAFAAGTLIGI